MVHKDDRATFEIKIIKYRALARDAPDKMTTERIGTLVAEFGAETSRGERSRPPLNIGTIDTKDSWFMRKGNLMIVYQEKIAPPLVPLTNEEQMKLIAESMANEDRWVKNFIERLAGVIRDAKH
jgi:hypothetical protein